MRNFFLAGFLFISVSTTYAQAKPEARFGKVVPADFVVSAPNVDSNSNAVILADVGSTDFVGNNSGDFTLVFKEKKRILIRNRNAFDIATVKVPVYIGKTFTSEEKFEEFDATTYNLENGQVVATKLDKTAVFNEKVDKEHSIRKFTFPNLKEGSIIEYQYTIKSPFYVHLRAWDFQDIYPCLWSEYAVTIPPMFKYITSRKGSLPYTIDTVKKVFRNYSIIETTDGTSSDQIYRISGDAINGSWAIKNVPAFKSESYTSSLVNYINRIQFQLMTIEYSASNRYQVVKDWYATSGDLLKDPDFGQQLSDVNSWVSDIMKEIGPTGNNYEKAKKIYEYVRNNFKCTDHDARWLSQPIKKTYQSKTGNVADINLLLTAILQNQHYEAQPTMLSTKDNGFANETTPLLSQFNYVLCRVLIDDKPYLLDATHSRLGFGKLTENAYNLSARVIDEKAPILLPMPADSLAEVKAVNVVIINGEKDGMEGSFTSNLGYIESLRLRDKLAVSGQEEFTKEIKKQYPADYKLTNIQFDSLKQYEEPVRISYDMTIKFGEDDIVYFNPLFSEAWKKNPFVAAERSYPVEMPYKINETLTLYMEIPKGYKVDEIPKSARIKLNEDDGMYEYIIAASAEKIQLRSRLVLKKATFTPDDYATLRDFFGYIVKKQAEQIVFKKIKNN